MRLFNRAPSSWYFRMPGIRIAKITGFVRERSPRLEPVRPRTEQIASPQRVFVVPPIEAVIRTNWPADEFFRSKGLPHALASAEVILEDIFGPNAWVRAAIRQTRGSSEPHVVLELLTETRTDYEMERTFLSRYLDSFPPGREGDAPTLVWNPGRL